MIDFCAQNTEFPARRIKSSLDKMNWIMGYQTLRQVLRWVLRMRCLV